MYIYIYIHITTIIIISIITISSGQEPRCTTSSRAGPRPRGRAGSSTEQVPRPLELYSITLYDTIDGVHIICLQQLF